MMRAEVEQLSIEPEPEPEPKTAATVAESPVRLLREELNKVEINHEHMAQLLPALGGFLSANNPLLAAVDAVQSSSGLVHWLGEMASEPQARDGAEPGGEGTKGGSWLSGLGWGDQPEEVEDEQPDTSEFPRRPQPPQHHDPDDDIGGLEYQQQAEAPNESAAAASAVGVHLQSAASSDCGMPSGAASSLAAGTEVGAVVGENENGKVAAAAASGDVDAH